MIFIVTDAVPNVPQTPEFFREAGHAQTNHHEATNFPMGARLSFQRMHANKHGVHYMSIKRGILLLPQQWIRKRGILIK
jgi:hypothetical protein